MAGDADIIPRVLKDFGDKPGIEFRADNVTKFNDANGVAPSGLPEAQRFAAAVGTSTQKLKQFVTEMNQGILAYQSGAKKMAATWDATEQRNRLSMEQAAPRGAGLPAVDPGLDRPASGPLPADQQTPLDLPSR